MAARRLDEHDIGAEVGEDPPGDRRGLAREVEDAQSVEQCWHASTCRAAARNLANLPLTSRSAYCRAPWSQSRIVDADCHILEPPDIWEHWLPERYQDRAPKLVKDPEGGDAWLTAVGGDPDPIGLVATPGMPFDEFRWFGVTYEEARKGCYNGASAARGHGPSTAWRPRSCSRRSAR